MFQRRLVDPQWSSIICMRVFIKKNGRLVLYRNRSSSATEHFQRKPHKFSDLHYSIVCGTISDILDAHTDRPNYSNARCACALRVNDPLSQVYNKPFPLAKQHCILPAKDSATMTKTPTTYNLHSQNSVLISHFSIHKTLNLCIYIQNIA